MPDPLIFGDIPGYPVGSLFEDRMALHRAGVHRATQAGISGRAQEGADSIVLSGGYEDDADKGAVIIYTGEGGRDNSTGKQVRDQVLTRGNHALMVSLREQLPVRLIRGYHPGNPFAPEVGYRYDGLFFVHEAWHELGKSGFQVWKFRLVQRAASDSIAIQNSPNGVPGPADRRIAYRHEVVRDPLVALHVKRLYEYSCQVCGLKLDTPAGPYAEGAHIQPLGAPHHGPDMVGNMLCLCPNHHVLFDAGAWGVAADGSLVGITGILKIHPDHGLRHECISYHREHIFVPEELRDLG